MITSRSNPRIRYLKKLTVRKFRKREGRFLLDDLTLIRENLENGLLPLEIYTADTDRLGAVPKTVPVIPVRYDLLAEISDQPSFAGTIAVHTIPETDSAIDASHRIILDDIQDPANLGAILRAAVLFGITSAWFTEGCADPWSLKALRSARCAALFLACYRSPAYHLAEQLQQIDTRILTADTRNGTPLHTASPPSRWTLIMGSEGKGISDALAACADQRLTISNSGRIESFNVAAAAAIILYHLTAPFQNR